jgi:tetratricopeptide (TPR) repeat protein
MKTAALLLSTLLITHTAPAFASPKLNVNLVPNTKNQAAPVDESPSPQEVQQTAKKITVRITSENNGGSGVLIAKKGSTYLVLTNAHVARRATQFQIQAPDGQKYTAKKIDGGFDAKYDLALLQFSSKTKYTLADLTDVASPLAPERTIYSAGFPFDSKDIRITSGQVTQLSDIPFDDGTQIGYTIDKGKKGIRQGMSGGAILDGRGKFLGINTLSNAPILPNYTYNDGSKPLPKLVARYQQANWGVPVYNFLKRVKPEILYGYNNLPKVERQITPTGYMAKINDQARRMTVRIENSGGVGSGVVIAKEKNNYYVLTAKHVVQDEESRTHKKFDNNQITTYDQDEHLINSTVVAEGVDLAVVKFSSNNRYPTAQLGEYIQQNAAIVFVGGFPARDKINSPLWQWQLNAGIMIHNYDLNQLWTQDNQSFSQGYDLAYPNVSYGGMSGGPVIDAAGNVIGVHGKAEGTDEIILGKSLGISIQTFTGLLPNLRIQPQLLKITKKIPPLPNLDYAKIFTITAPPPDNLDNSDGKSWLTYGNQLYRMGLLDKSVAAFDKAIAKGQVAKGNYGKTISLFFLKRSDLAKVAIMKAIAVVPKDERAKYYYFWTWQSKILSSLKEYDASLQAINVAILLKPNDLVLRFEKANLLSFNKRKKEALALYNEVIYRQPHYYAYLNRGDLKNQLRDRKGAILDFNRAIKINPNFDAAYSSRGIAKDNLGDKKGAILDYDQSIKLNPKNNRTYSLRGQLRNDLGNKKGAILDYDQSIKLNPKSDMAYLVYLSRGLAKYDLGDKKGAILDYTQSTRLNPKSDVAYFFRGQAKLSLRDAKGAILDFNRAIIINPKNDVAYFSRGQAKLLSLRDKEGAILDFDRAIEIDPAFGNAYAERGYAKFISGDRNRGILDIEQALRINPKNDLAYVYRGRTKFAVGNNNGAILDFDTAIEIDPTFGRAYLRRGTAKFALGDRRGAMSDLTKAIDLLRRQGDKEAYQEAIVLIEKIKRSI